ncbi:MAG: hypothetical protein U5S82_05600 [Gammaproteobacteria bacterium]|nr:hypothetical protein [Gammaproteobacteria bacterium]
MAEQVDDGIDRVIGGVFRFLQQAFDQLQRLFVVCVVPDRKVGRRSLGEAVAGFFERYSGHDNSLFAYRLQIYL